MKKITLDVETLQVTTFEAQEEQESRGTAAGHLRTDDCPLTLDDTCWCTEKLTCWC